MIRRFLVWLGLRIARWGGCHDVLPLSQAVLAAQGMAKDLMAAQEHVAGRSGESKRHQVLAALLKRGLSEADAALAIEVAWRRMA